MCFNSTMTPRQIQLVRSTLAEAARHQEVAALVFYRRLFELDPALRPLFKSDIQEQAKKLTDMLAALVGMLDDTKNLLSELRAMGARHAGYGVKDAHYATVGTALLDMLAVTLGRQFTPEAREAWTVLYGAVEATMKAGAHEVG
jgi:hemoglobin-like flavoprotein